MPYHQQYQQLQRHLQSPRRILVDPSQRKCNPPEDPNWPAPTTQEEIRELMRRLPQWAQIVCALTAAEMVLPMPIWEEDSGNETLSEEEEQIEAPRRAIETTWQWLDGEASQAELDAANADVRAAMETAIESLPAEATGEVAAAARAAGAAGWAIETAKATETWVAVETAEATEAWVAVEAAAWAAVWAAWAAWSAWAVEATGALEATGAVDHAVWTARNVEFYREWWDLCRCRLAFILEARPFI